MITEASPNHLAFDFSLTFFSCNPVTKRVVTRDDTGRNVSRPLRGAWLLSNDGLADIAGPRLPEAQDLNSPNKSGERTTSRKVAIINASMAPRFFGEANPIGKRFGWGDPPDVKYDVGNLREETRHSLGHWSSTK